MNENKVDDLMSFPMALDKVTEGKRISKKEWDDRRSYGLLKDSLLQLHKAGEAEEVTHPWILNDGDLLGWDWFVLD